MQLTTTVRPSAMVTPLVMITSASTVPATPLVLSMPSKVGELKPNSGTGGGGGGGGGGGSNIILFE